MSAAMPIRRYLGDGVAEELITQLGSLHPAGLNVVGLTSVMRYKKTDKPLDQIARELGGGLRAGGERAARRPAASASPRN